MICGIRVLNRFKTKLERLIYIIKILGRGTNK